MEKAIHSTGYRLLCRHFSRRSKFQYISIQTSRNTECSRLRRGALQRFISAMSSVTACHVDVPLPIASGGPSFRTGLLITGRFHFHSHFDVKTVQSVLNNP